MAESICKFDLNVDKTLEFEAGLATALGTLADHLLYAQEVQKQLK